MGVNYLRILLLVVNWYWWCVINGCNLFKGGKCMIFKKPTRVWSYDKGIVEVWGPAPAKEADYIIVPAKGYKITKIKKKVIGK